MSALFDLMTELRLQPADDAASVYGDVDGCAMKLTILSGQPLSILAAFYVGGQQPHSAIQWETPPVAGKTDLSLEDGFLWVTLYELAETSGVELAQSFRQLVAAMKTAGISADGQCGLCGDQNVDVQLLDGRAVRVCARCQETKQREVEELNRPDGAQAILIPLGIIGVSITWAIVWVGLDYLLEWLNAGNVDRVLILNKLTILPLLAIGALLFLVGSKLGDWLWKSGVCRISPMFLNLVCALGAVLLGEFLYVLMSLWRNVGLFNVEFAAKLFWLWITGYTLSWAILKVVGVIAVYCGCLAGTGKTANVTLA